MGTVGGMTGEVVQRLPNGGARWDWGTAFAGCAAPNGRGADGDACEEAEEVARLRSEVHRLRAENAALRKSRLGTSKPGGEGSLARLARGLWGPPPKEVHRA